MLRNVCFFVIASILPLAARVAPALPPELASYLLDPAPESNKLQLKVGDRLAICGDSITEQKRYSVLIETYLTCCMPRLRITCRQYGWSGEIAGGFLKRLKSDVLRFKPTISTTCYGMNDFGYVPYNEAFAAEYRKNQTAIVKAFKEIGCQVVLGSSGIIDSVPHWVKSSQGTQQDLNLALSRFRNIDIEIAKSENVSFADVYRPMLLADFSAKKQYGLDFKLSGKDGVHPDWAGHIIMAYAFLKGMGLDGDLGSITFDEATEKATAAKGHEVLSATHGEILVRSSRLPFSPGPGPNDKDNSPHAGLALVPFDDELNRLTLRIVSPKAPAYNVTWGAQTKSFTAGQLSLGVNIAKEFDNNPLVPAFMKVQEAVTKKQNYETRQIKELAHGLEGVTDIEATFALTEKVRHTLEMDAQSALQPVEHTITVRAIEK